MLRRTASWSSASKILTTGEYGNRALYGRYRKFHIFGSVPQSFGNVNCLSGQILAKPVFHVSVEAKQEKSPQLTFAPGSAMPRLGMGTEPCRIATAVRLRHSDN